jgi:ribosomal protein S18 acetylase RimI-like enzyme
VSFADTVTEENVLGYVTESDGRYQVAMLNGELAGVVSIRDNSHLFHLYVAERFHRRGIARALWQAARDDALKRGNPGRFTVKSSPYAVGVYERFGFRATGPRAEQGGLVYVPMLLDAAP